MENKEYRFFNEMINAARLKILENGIVKASDDWHFTQLSSPFSRLYFVIGGEAEVTCNGKKTILKPGRMYLVPLYNVCDYDCKEFLHKFYIHFRMEMMPGQDVFEGYRTCMEMPYEEETLNRLIENAREGTIGGEIENKGILLICISRFIRENQEILSKNIEKTSRYQEVFSYIQDHLASSLTIKSIADGLGLKAESLSKNFRNDTGISLKKYINSKVIQKSQDQLLLTDKPVKEISAELGFGDEFQFSRYFKSSVGMSPSLYRTRNNLYK